VADLLSELSWRGLKHQCTDEQGLRSYLAEREVRLYNGFDPTAVSLHLGNLVPMMVLLHAQRHGATPIVVLGGGTGLIGDPSGRDEERALMDQDAIDRNIAAQRAQFERILDTTGPNAVRFENNIEWISDLSFVDVLRDIGKHFSVNAMIAKDSVRERLENREQGISYTEFSYMIVQAYDFLHLHDKYGCRLQTGGSDQWGNITAGIDLIRRKRGVDAFGLTVPLLTTSAGKKFGKSEGNAIWLDADLTSPYAMYQYLVRTEDDDVASFLGMFTLLSQTEIADLVAAHEACPEKREAHRALAAEVTRRVHGAEGLAKAEAATKAFFGGSLGDLTDSELREIFADVPSVTMPRARIAEGIPVVDLLVESGACASRSAARKLVDGGGAYVNNERIGANDAVLGDAALDGRSTLVVRSGKRSYYLVRFE